MIWQLICLLLLLVHKKNKFLINLILIVDNESVKLILDAAKNKAEN